MEENLSRAEELQDLIGEYMHIDMKNISVSEGEDDTISVVSSVRGYLIDVSENFLYIGKDPDEGYIEIVKMDDWTKISLINAPEMAELKVLNQKESDKDVH